MSDICIKNVSAVSAVSTAGNAREENLPDMTRLAELSRMAIGDRTLRAFSVQSGLSEGFLSRLTTGKLLSVPTRRSLSKLTSDTSKPQNGVTYWSLVQAAGYPSVKPEPEKGTEDMSKRVEDKSVPDWYKTSAFPAFLTLGALEKSGQLGPVFTIHHEREMFFIESKTSKSIVGIPAFCALDAVDETVRQTKWYYLAALSTLRDKAKDYFFVVLTNQPQLYEQFDKEGAIVGTEGEFYIALTETMTGFSQQRAVNTVDANIKPEAAAECCATYDLTKET